MTFEYARANLEGAGYKDIVLIRADGGFGYPELQPYDRIAMTAACREIPPRCWSSSPLRKLVSFAPKEAGGIYESNIQVADLNSLNADLAVIRNLPCRSHYFIRNGRVIEAAPWSDEMVAQRQARDRRRRPAHRAGSAVGGLEAVSRSERAPKPRNGWLSKIRDLLAERR